MSETAPDQPADLVASLLEVGAFSRPLGRKSAVSLDHVSEPAQPFLAALAIRAKQAKRAWVVCPHVRAQEQLQHDLALWGVSALFLPEVDFSGFEDALPDPDATAERLAILQQAGSEDEMVVVLCEDSLNDVVPVPGALDDQKLEISTGSNLDLGKFTAQLDEAGYERTSQVFQRGQFAVRGGILDVFSWQHSVPVRVELFDDEVESIREFDVDEQTSIAKVDSVTVMLSTTSASQTHCPLRDYIRPEDLVIAAECESAIGSVRITAGTSVQGEEDYSTACHDHPLGSFDAGDFILQEAKRKEFLSQMTSWRDDGWRVAMFFNTRGELDRFTELVDGDYLQAGVIQPFFGRLAQGFTVPSAKLAVLADAEIFGRYQNLRSRRLAERRMKQRRISGDSDMRKFEEDDLVVHQEYGIGRFQGIEEKDGGEVLVIHYFDDARLFVPVDQAHLVSRYVGVGKANPPLNKLGDAKWTKTRKKAEQSIMDYAAQLVSTQAARQTEKSYQHSPDTKWQWEFENSFLYKETPDQLTAIEATKSDMESDQPMDRLICGDVGFGKTEVAIRAAFKSVMSGMQVAVLVPTTVLAQQHFQNFRERMSDYPITLGLLSRYRTPKQQRETIAGVASGSIDIVIGTHRLISRDISFKNLGLVVIDEEQRFGVRHKERFKEMFRMVDVLTLSATPIPRTLYLSLMGVRDMSTIDTPPTNRIPVQTTICPYDERVIKMAVERELKRQGQVFILHNRVQTINKFREKVEKLVPGSRVVVGHGQMEEGALEDVMNKFIAHEYDVLVATTIIESGIDIPNANTIVIDRADRFGLADLYQLRGRVGRAQTKAFAILMIPRDLLTVGDARKRINAIKQYTALGSGFRIAMRDLEIRGAGNLLGTQQSGHIAAVGFDMYCRLLRKSVAKLRGERTTKTVDIIISIDFICLNEVEFARNPASRLPTFIPADYMEEPKHRISSYRELAEISTLKELNATIRNWEDRFGKRPEEVDHLFRATELKVRAAQKNVSAVEIQKDKLILTRNGQGIQVDGKYPRLEADDLKERLIEAVEMIKLL